MYLTSLLNDLLTQFSAHPTLYTLGVLTTVGSVMKRVAPNLRVTKMLVALATDAPELVTIAISFATKKQLLKALELAGHVVEDVAKAVEEPAASAPVVEPKPVEPVTVTVPDGVALEQAVAALQALVAKNTAP